MPSLAPLTREVGSALGGWGGSTVDPWEDNPEMRWPLCTQIYDKMRRTDGQVASVMRAIGLPVRRTGWQVVGQEVDPRVRAFTEAQLGLQKDARGRNRRLREGISWDPFLRHVLLHLPLGHMAFEQLYRIGPPPPGIAGLPAAVAHLRKLAPRMPRTLSRFDVADDGGLNAVGQWVTRRAGDGLNAGYFTEEVIIPIERLVMFVNEQEGADWTGTSILRAAWKNWLIKDQLLRLSGMVLERNGMGLPVVKHPSNASPVEAQRVVREARAGERAGVTVPYDFEFSLEGVSGSTVDILPWVKYHDQAIGRSALAMFLDLGHDDGARSLGETFLDFFTDAENASLAYIEEIVTEHVVRDLVALNFGEDEPYPAVIADEITPDTALSPADLATLVEKGIIVPDLDLERDQRRRHRLPEAAPPPDLGPLAGLPPIDDQLLPPARSGVPSTTSAVAPFSRGRADDLDELQARADQLRARIAARKRALAAANRAG